MICFGSAPNTRMQLDRFAHETLAILECDTMRLRRLMRIPLGGCEEAHCQFQARYGMLLLQSHGVAKVHHADLSLDLESR